MDAMLERAIQTSDRRVQEEITRLRQQVATLTEQQNLAVEALKRCVVLGFGTDCEMYAKEALVPIQSSEVTE